MTHEKWFEELKEKHPNARRVIIYSEESPKLSCIYPIKRVNEIEFTLIDMDAGYKSIQSSRFHLDQDLVSDKYMPYVFRDTFMKALTEFYDIFFEKKSTR